MAIWHGGSASCGCLQRSAAGNRSSLLYGDLAEKLEEAQITIEPPPDPTRRVRGMKKPGAHRYRCRCGRQFGEKTTLYSVLSGNTRSCGCLHAERARRLNPGSLTAGAVRRRMLEAGRLSPAFDLPDDHVFRSHEQVRFVCVCGKEHSSVVHDVHAGRVRSCGCVKSHAERELFDFVASIAPDAKRNTRQALRGRELDVWVPSARLAIELNGLFWHSEKVFEEERARRDMVDKLEQLRAAGCRGLFFFEDEWRERRQAVEGFIRAALGAKSQVGARQCRMYSDEGALRSFIADNHIQGASAGGVVIGLSCGDKPVAAIQLEPARKSIAVGDDSWELTRYCCGSVGVRGGLSKLIKAFRDGRPGATIVTFSEERLSDGRVYAAAGFERGVTSGPRYWYMRGGDGVRRHRFGFRKEALRSRGWLLPDETERDCMIRMGYTRVWDAGKTKWISRP